MVPIRGWVTAMLWCGTTIAMSARGMSIHENVPTMHRDRAVHAAARAQLPMVYARSRARVVRPPQLCIGRGGGTWIDVCGTYQEPARAVNTRLPLK